MPDRHGIGECKHGTVCVCVTDSNTCLSISFIPSTSSVDPTSSSVSLIPTCLLLFCTIYFYFYFYYYHCPFFYYFWYESFSFFLFKGETLGSLLELGLSIKFSFLLLEMMDRLGLRQRDTNTHKNK